MVYNIRRLAYEIVFESSLVSEIAVSLTTNQTINLRKEE